MHAQNKEKQMLKSWPCYMSDKGVILKDGTEQQKAVVNHALLRLVVGKKG